MESGMRVHTSVNQSSYSIVSRLYVIDNVYKKMMCTSLDFIASTLMIFCFQFCLIKWKKKILHQRINLYNRIWGFDTEFHILIFEMDALSFQICRSQFVFRAL